MKIVKMLSAVFPQRCAMCDRLILPDSLICDECEEKSAQLRVGEDFCRFCGAEKEFCSCRGTASGINGVCAVFYYENEARRAIGEFKFGSQRSKGRFFGEEMAKRAAVCFPDVNFDIVTCVPLSKKGMKMRGYNQSEILAKSVSHTLGVKYSDTLEKTAEIPSQHTLSAEQRKGNVLGAYEVLGGAQNSLCGKRVLLCDDIRTTGSTLGECARVLRDAGSAEVYCVCAAVTRRKKRY